VSKTKMSRWTYALPVALAILVAAPAPVTAEATDYDGKYTGAISCDEIPNVTGRLRTGFLLTIADGKARYEREVLRADTSIPQGVTERGSGTVSAQPEGVGAAVRAHRVRVHQHGLGPPARVEREGRLEDRGADVAGDADRGGGGIQRRGLADVGDPERSPAARHLALDIRSQPQSDQDGEQPQRGRVSAPSHGPFLPGRQPPVRDGRSSAGRALLDARRPDRVALGRAAAEPVG
jgi:hypothetical protein